MFEKEILLVEITSSQGDTILQVIAYGWDEVIKLMQKVAISGVSVHVSPTHTVESFLQNVDEYADYMDNFDDINELENPFGLN